MTHLFLTSSIEIPGVGESIRRHLDTVQPLKTAFIMTPGEGEANQNDITWMNGERDMLNVNNFVTFDYTITGKKLETIVSDLHDIDVLYITGGNEFYFKAQSNISGFDQFVRNFVSSGRSYIGSSCGSIIAGQNMSASLNLSDTSKLSPPVDVTGFGLVNFTILPHWGSTEFHTDWLSNESFNHMYGESTTLIALNNYEYVEVLGDQFKIIDVRNEE